MSYPGGKNGAGVYQQIINRMPPHSVYIEPFLGGGAIMRLKRPAGLNVGLDLDPRVIAAFGSSMCGIDDGGSLTAGTAAGRSITADSSDRRRRGSPRQFERDRPMSTTGANSGATRYVFECRDAFEFLRTYSFGGAELVYCDPPYLHRTRTRHDLYTYELTDLQHCELLDILTALRCRVIVSGYWTKLYAGGLKAWESHSFTTTNRAGRKVTEWIWMNFTSPTELHDYRYLGADYRERERIKRKKLRWTSRLQRMPVLERQALLSAIADIDSGGDADGVHIRFSDASGRIAKFREGGQR